jgi:ATP-binding cassette subfamily B (MDR/TAP) protein 1
MTTKLNKAFEQAAHVATEAMASARTVAAFNLQPQMAASFKVALAVPTAAGKRRARMGGMGHGFSQLTMMCTYALCFWAGAQFIKNGWMDFEQLMTSFFAIAMSAVGMGHASAFAVDASKAEAAKRSMFALIERPSAIDPDAPAAAGAPGGAKEVLDVESGAAPAPAGAGGRLELRNLKFAYPNRPDVQVLRGIDLTIEPGACMRADGWV